MECLLVSLCSNTFTTSGINAIILYRFIGVLISTICDEETSAIHMALGSFYPNILCSGVLWPIEGIPIFFRKIVYFLPQAYTIDSLRCVLSRGKKKRKQSLKCMKYIKHL